MVDALVRTNLGTLGSAILNFYITNSLWINGLLLVIALAIMLGRWNYTQFISVLLAEFKAAHADKLTPKNRSQLRFALKKSNLPWENAGKSAWVPFLIPPGPIKLYLKNKANLERLFSLDVLLDKLVK
jgi:hypothetical protein